MYTAGAGKSTKNGKFKNRKTWNVTRLRLRWGNACLGAAGAAAGIGAMIAASTLRPPGYGELRTLCFSRQREISKCSKGEIQGDNWGELLF